MNLSAGKAKIAFQIAKTLKDHGCTAYFAGGCVRDHLMALESYDIDIATTATPDQVEKIFPRTIPVGKQFGVVLVVEEDLTFEVATFRSEGGYVDGRHPTQVEFTVPEEDAKRRDFTVNGLFYDPFKEQVIDFVGGEADIKGKLIRAIGNPEDRFDEDKLRLLRAVRFASTLGFKIDPDTWKAVCQKSNLIHQVSPERIRDELIKIFTRKDSGRGFLLLSESGLMKEVLPEIETMKGVQQQPDYHPEGDVFVHTHLLMEKLEKPSTALALGALFHDVGKPGTFEVRNGKITFYQHEHLGAEITQTIMKRLRFSNDEIRDVTECVKNHMKFADVQKMRSGKLKRFIVRNTFTDEMELHRIDCASSHGMLDNYHFLESKLKEFEKEELQPKPLLNGHDLMALGMKPSPSMKEALEELYELQLEGRFPGREEALEYARQMIRDKYQA
ncbi:MAG: CCA tRNA nucleotidyltransferase [Candidatus Omnitrophica bacterium]|nr:CCA tRNA nucleotidyltransferase [Candidatus Omnitrophota bacterium]